MSIFWHDVVAIAPETSKADPATQTAVISIVNLQIDDDTWGSTADADVGRRYLAAHLATLALRRGAGMIASEGVGSLSRSYTNPSWLKSSLGLTGYGMEYERLTRLLPSAFGIVS